MQKIWFLKILKIKISDYLSLALTIEYLVITHRESLDVIYYRTAGDIATYNTAIMGGESRIDIEIRN